MGFISDKELPDTGFHRYSILFHMPLRLAHHRPGQGAYNVRLESWIFFTSV
jgi:hypothetical protein